MWLTGALRFACPSQERFYGLCLTRNRSIDLSEEGIEKHTKGIGGSLSGFKAFWDSWTIVANRFSFRRFAKCDGGASRKRFRDLSVKYHPDKTGNDPVKSAYFVKLQRAMEAITSGTADGKVNENALMERVSGTIHRCAELTPVVGMVSSINLGGGAHLLNSCKTEVKGRAVKRVERRRRKKAE